MQTNAEIKSFVKDRIKNSEKQFLWGMAAILFVVPMITIFMPKIYLFLQPIVWVFMYPFLRLVYNNAKGKTLEMEDCLHFKGFGKFLKTSILVFLCLCSYLLPFVLCLGVQLVGMFLKMDIVILVGNILLVLYGIIFLIKSTRYILYPFYVFQYEEDDLSPNLILSKCRKLMKDEYKTLFFFILSFIGWFLLNIITVNLISFIIFPMFFSCLAVWFYNHEFGEPMKQYYDVIGNNFTKNINLTQQAMLIQQQQELKESRQQAIENYQKQQIQNSGLNNIQTQQGIQAQYQINQSFNNYNQSMPYQQQGYNQPMQGGYGQMQGQQPMNNGYSQPQGYNQNQMPYQQQGYSQPMQSGYGQMQGQQPMNNGYNQQTNQPNPYYNPYNKQ